MPLRPALLPGLLTLGALAFAPGCTPRPDPLVEAASYRNFLDLTAGTQIPVGLGDESVDYAMRARAEFKWARETPDDIFKDAVVTQDFVDEEQRSWRPEMYRRFAPLAHTCATRREAILLIAKKAADTCGVKYSTDRRRANQCVAESLETGTASCTGLSILLAAAYRSVGIPARLAGVAEWGDRPGNHTWVEVWDTDGWHFIEYYPDKEGLDHGWILEPIAALDPANPASRVIARSRLLSANSVYRLPWAPERFDLTGEDRTAVYQKLPGAAPRAGANADSGTVSFVAHDNSGARVALEFSIYDGDKAVSTGRTPGPLDDMNNTPRRTLRAGRDYTVRYKNKNDLETSEVVRAVAGKKTERILPAE